MPSFSKKSLSLFLRNRCERQFVLSLYTEKERKAHGMPPKQDVRAALGLVGEAGYEWQAEKVSELESIFGADNVHINPNGSNKQPGSVDLLAVLPSVAAYQFVVEAAYHADTPVFRNAVGLEGLQDYYGDDIDISNTHPDIVQILPPLCAQLSPLSGEEPNPYELEVLPNGETVALNADDSRLRLRVIDVKLTAEPGAHYFAEVVYYSMTLSAWLIEHGLAGAFVVVAAPAVWPGSHQASHLAQRFSEWQRLDYAPTAEEMALALEEDVEIAPLDVFTPRLRRFFAEELPGLVSKPWQELTWHVDFHCKGCEFLGYPWKDKDGTERNDPRQCWPTAEENDHLSRVVGLTRGASMKLSNDGVINTSTLATLQPQAPVFDDHQGLRAKRSAFPHRANALINDTSSIIPQSGGDATMPRWPDLHIYLFLDYDLSSAITASIAVRAFWSEPLDYDSQYEKKTLNWPQQGEDEVFLIDQRDINRERAEFLKFLRHLRSIFNTVLNEDQDSTGHNRHNKQSTFQIYLWDESQRKHLVRVIGRHLPQILADNTLRGLAWLFPPPELLAQVEQDTRQSPITLVSDVVQNTVAVPVAHHYRLIDIVQTYLPPGWNNAPTIHPLYQEPMSDLIPAERIHEWWQRIGQWDEKQQLIKETARKKVLALNLVIRRLERDLKDFLARHAAPPIVRPPKALGGLAPQGRLWLEFSKLNSALEQLEVHSIRAMPPHEREARLKSARLRRRLEGQEYIDALNNLSQVAGQQLSVDTDLFVYEIRPGSEEVNLSAGDFLYALSPESRHGFLDGSPFSLLKGTPLAGQIWASSIADAQMTQVTVEAIERTNRLIVLRGGWRNCIRLLEQHTTLDFSKNVILDRIHRDYLTKKIELSVKGIGNPPSASAEPRILEAMGLAPNSPEPTTIPTPAEQVFWQAQALQSQQTQADLQSIRQTLEAHLVNKGGTTLNDSQWKAWEDALSHRLSLIWGPPGTGKSRTLRAIIQGAVLDAYLRERPLRLLITANTYTAVDNVLLDLEQELRQLLPNKPYQICRVQSTWRREQPDASKYTDLVNLELDTYEPSKAAIELRSALDDPDTITIVGCPPQQLHNLAVAGIKNRKPRHVVRDWFDIIVLDEASQMDVATSTLVFTKLASDGSCMLAGDDLQLPPIQKAESPQDLEHLVGSVYNYFRHWHGIAPNPLEVNYRSNSTLVEFTKSAGYSPGLQSHSPTLKLNLSSPVPTEQPVGWPDELLWSAAWSEFLDPDFPCVSFVYEDVLSSQTNAFEADAIAALLWLLRAEGRLANQLHGERGADGSLVAPSSAPYDAQGFWAKAVGVVSPHRAQVSKIVTRLQSVFPGDPGQAIRDAVDTVERFQGQQRDIIIGSFGLGDPDIISAEDEFLYNLNRFNVMTSRARAKLIVFTTRSLLEHLSDDIDILRESHLLKRYAESHCGSPKLLELGVVVNGSAQPRYGELRRR